MGVITFYSGRIVVSGVFRTLRLVLNPSSLPLHGTESPETELIVFLLLSSKLNLFTAFKSKLV